MNASATPLPSTVLTPMTYEAPAYPEYFNDGSLTLATGQFRPAQTGYYSLSAQFGVSAMRTAVGADHDPLIGILELQRSINDGVAFTPSIAGATVETWFPPSGINTVTRFLLSCSLVIKVDDILGGDLVYRWAVTCTVSIAGITFTTVPMLQNGTMVNLFSATRIGDL